jgi:hypothetical protein
MGLKTTIILTLIVIANITTLVLNANRLQDKALLNKGSFDEERTRFNVINLVFIVGIPFLTFLYYLFRFSISKSLNSLKSKEFRYRTFWVPLTLAITFLILSNFINSLRKVKSNETDEDESTSLSGIVISFVSIAVFTFMITYNVTN